MGIEVKDLGDAIDEVEDLIREMNRTGECAGYIPVLQNLLVFLTAVRAVSLDDKALIKLLVTR